MLKQGFQFTKKIVTACDLFSTTELLRYKENPQYKSANGGLCSIAVIIAFAIIFTQTILSTFDKTYISSQSTLFEETEPSYYTTQDSPFLFAVGVTGYNLNHPTTKFFNIEVSQKKTLNGVKTTTYYPLVQCNRSDWVSMNPTLGTSYDTIGLDSYLCLQSNISFAFAGKFTSKLFEYVKISVKDCKITAGDNRTCVNSSLIDSAMASSPISFNYYFVNTIINADDSDYLGSYVEDRNYFTFTKSMGTSANIFISSYTIQTDQSLWPWQDVSVDSGGVVYQPTQRYVYTPIIVPNATEYIQLFLRKSSLSLSIARSFKKYDDTLSYIGGLFSTFMVFLFVMMKYNQYSYEIQIASKIFKYKENKLIQSSKFNLISCAAYCFYCMLDFIGAAPKWTTLRQFDDVRQEIGKQLDLKLMLRKISFLEDCVNYIFEDYELQCLHLKGKMTLEEAETIRRRFSSRKHLLRLKKKYKNQNGLEENPSIQSNKDAISINNQQVFDSHHLNKENVKNIERMAQEISDGELIFRNNQEETDSVQSESQSQKKEKDALSEYVESIMKLQEQATRGNQRCKKIYDNLDKIIKAIPSELKLTSQFKSKEIFNETEYKLNTNKEKEFSYLNTP